MSRLLDEIAQQQNAAAAEAPAATHVQPEAPAEQPAAATEEVATTTEPEQAAPSATADTTESPAAPEPTEPRAYANEELAEADAYLRRNPGKQLSDYQALKTPTAEINPADLVTQYLTEKEGMTASEAKLELKKLQAEEEEDEDFAYEEGSVEQLENAAKKEKMEALIAKATAYRESVVADAFAKEPETTATEKVDYEQVLQKWQADTAEIQKDYLAKTYDSLKDIDAISVDFNGESISYTPDDNFRKELRSGAEDIASFTQKFYDAENRLTDAAGLHRDVTVWANPATRKPMLDFLLEQAYLRGKSDTDKNRRNVNLDKVNTVQNDGTSDEKSAYEQWRSQRQRGSF